MLKYGSPQIPVVNNFASKFFRENFSKKLFIAKVINFLMIHLEFLDRA